MSAFLQLLLISPLAIFPMTWWIVDMVVKEEIDGITGAGTVVADEPQE